VIEYQVLLVVATMPSKEELQANEKEQRQLHHRLILFTLICSITGFDYVSHGSNFLEPYAKAFANSSMSATRVYRNIQPGEYIDVS
jgi:hypothetical protein